MFHSSPFRPRRFGKRLTALGLAIACFAEAIAPHTAWSYERHDLRQIVRSEPGPTGPRHHLDTGLIDTIIADLSRHAANYPATFAMQSERQLATDEARNLSGMLDILVSTGGQQDPALLLRVARLNAMAHNLDVKGAAPHAEAAYRQLLAQVPDHAQGNYGYGLFLASTARGQQALPYLEKAMNRGVDAARYTLALAHMGLGDKAKTLRLMEGYVKVHPEDGSAQKLMLAIHKMRLSSHLQNN